MTDNRARAQWAIRRAREVFGEEGWTGVRRRRRQYFRKRRATRQPRLPQGHSHSAAWPTSLVIVAGAEPRQCFHYRVEQKMQAAAALGVPARVVDPVDPDAVSDAVQLASVVIVFRQASNPGVETALRHARRLGLPVVYEADDAVYRQDLLAANPNLDTVPRSLRRAVLSGASAHLELMRRCDHVLAATEPLARDMGRFVPGSAFVVENGIDSVMVEIAAGVVADPSPPRRAGDDRIVIGYGSGSRAHDVDLAVSATGLARVMAVDERVELLLVGPLRVPDELAPFAARITTHQALGYGEYLRQLAACDLTIAPLLDLPFNRFKSQVKYLEAALVGVPFVASPVPYADYIENGRTGLIAAGDQWDQAVGELASDPGLRSRLAAAAHADVASSHLADRPLAQLSRMLAALS